MNLTEISYEIQKAQAVYEAKAQELIQAQSNKEDAEVALIRADSSYKRLRLEVAVARSRIESLKEQGWNTRKEASIA